VTVDRGGGAGGAGTSAYDREVDTRDAALRWARTWERGWLAHDPTEIVALYADGAHFRSHPFREPEVARDYIERVLGEEESADCEFGEPVVDGDRAAVEWRAHTTLRDGGEERLAGVSLLRFDEQGLVVEQRDVWVG
jgi:nuclear transport factor 2 (NTF2) superfamily protein